MDVGYFACSTFMNFHQWLGFFLWVTIIQLICYLLLSFGYVKLQGEGVISLSIYSSSSNKEVIEGLTEKFKEVERRSDVKAIVLTGKRGRFSSGFDINVFQIVHKTGDISHLPDVSVSFVNILEDSKKPTVAAVEGLTLGGGLELGFHARIAAPRTQLDLRELTLRVIPGFGGTKRLPRLIGLPKASEVMVFSKPMMFEEEKNLVLLMLYYLLKTC